VRDEIIQLVRDALMVELAANVPHPRRNQKYIPPLRQRWHWKKTLVRHAGLSTARTGVEIVTAELRKGVWYYSVRDLRNTRIVHNVTLKSARRLWQYAIAEHEKIHSTSKN